MAKSQRDYKEYNKLYYERVKEKRKPEIRQRQKEIKDFFQKYKIEEGCSICGYDKNARALQFHHISNDKEHNIARMMAQGRSILSIQKEIHKCIIVCANCHAELHDNAALTQW